MNRLPKRQASRRATQRARRGTSALRIEHLEDRALLAATFTWTGGAANGNWLSAGNWSMVGSETAGGIVGVPDTLGDSAVINSGTITSTGASPFSLTGLTVTGGATTLTSNITVDTADFSANTGSVNASANALVVTNQLVLTPTVAAVISAGNTITVTGTNIVNDTVAGAGARTLILSGGTLTFPAGALGLSFFRPTGDGDSQISNTNLYTHAINPSGDGTETVNTIPFTGAPPGALAADSLAPKTYNLNGVTPTTIPNSIAASNTGTGVIQNNLSGFTGVTPGGLSDVLSDFNHGSPFTRDLTLTGLQPDTYYSVRTYEKSWDPSFNRNYNIAYDVGANGGAPELTSPTIDQNHPELTPALAALGVTQQSVWVENYVYRTGAGETSIKLTITGSTTVPYHFYGVTNQALTGVGVNLPNTRIAGPPGATVDTRGRTTTSTFQNLTVAANAQVPAPSVATPDSYATLENTPLTRGNSAPVVAAYNVPAGTAGNQNHATGLGLDFDVNSPLTLTQFGVFDADSNGIAGTLTVQLYNRASQAQVGETVTFTTASPGTLVGGNRFKDLVTPINLPVGQYSIVAYGFTADQNGNSNAPTPWTTNNLGGQITFTGGGRFGFGGVGTYPTTGDGGPANRYAAGTFAIGGGDPGSLLANDLAGLNATTAGTFPTALGGTVTITSGGGFTYNGANLTIDPPAGVHVFDSFTYTATNGSTTVTGTATIDVTGQNDLPVVTPIVPRTIDEGAGITLMGSATDADQGEQATLKYRWYVNGNLVSSTVGAATAPVSNAALIAAGADDGASPGGTAYSLRLEVEDAQGAIVSSNTSTLTIVDVPIEVDTSLLTTDEVLVGSTVDFPLTAIDPSADDLASVTYLIDWNGDGDFTDAGDASIVDNTGLGISPQRVFNSPGTFHINFAVRDAFGVMSAVVPYTLTVSQVIQIGDDIIIGGSNTIGDKIIVSLKSAGIITVKVNTTTYSAIDFNEFSTITIYGNGGADNITTVKLPIGVTVFGGPGADYIAGTAHADVLNGDDGFDRILGIGGDDTMDGGAGNDSMDGGVGNDTMYGGNHSDTMYGQAGDDIMYGDLSPDSFDDPVPGNDKMDGGLGNDLMHGGDGADSMTGNAGHDVVLGDAGNDRVLGAAGRDILIGNDGIDNLDGGGDDDILIGADSGIDTDDATLLAALDYWANSGDPYEDRVANLQGGDLSGVTLDDGAKDLLTGQTGRDWYIASLSDNDTIRGRVGSGASFEILDN